MVNANIFVHTLAVAWLGAVAANASDLVDAIKANDVMRVQAALTSGADFTEIDQSLGTPLHIAAAQDSADIALLLITAGADVDAEASRTLRKAHPLHIAAVWNSTAVATLLLERGAAVDSRDMIGRTPLMMAATYGQTEVATMLLQAGADPLAEEATYYRDTPAYTAAMSGHLGIVKAMLSIGINVDARNALTGETLLWGAAIDNRLDVVEFLLANGADPNIADNKGKMPFDVSSDPLIKDLLRKFAAGE